VIWCRFEADGVPVFGLVEGEKVLAIEGSPFATWTKTGKSTPLASVDLLVPVLPGTFYAIGSNYENHVVERSKIRGTAPKFYKEPRVGYRANSALVPHGAHIVKPKGSGPNFQYEAELVAVIGKKARNVTPEEATDHIFGWTIGNDVTGRAWQRDDPTNLRGKNADTFKPMGPWIVTDVSPKDMVTTVTLNGNVVHKFRTGNMLFDAGTVISAISRTNTLFPGDVVWLGTDELPQNLKPGDTLDIEISGVGLLRNSVVAE
jgi:2-keto-4-pentenoate hydratase/2-oxohepta-3-ene-1,7-dioic acid hydratase in catechol pathway